jgi:hypothetical protein
MVNCIAGKRNEALEALHQALRQGYPREEAQRDPELKDLRSLPQFAAIMHESGGK